MKYKTRLIAKESQMAKLKSMVNAAMDEAIFVQTQGTVFSPSSTLNALRDTVKAIQAEEDAKKFYNHELDYIAFAEKFADFALKMKGVRLRTVDSDELLDFNMAEFQPVRARGKPSILQRPVRHQPDDTLHSLLQSDFPPSDPSSGMTSMTSPGEMKRSPPQPAMKAVRKEETSDAPSTSTTTGRTASDQSPAFRKPIAGATVQIQERVPLTWTVDGGHGAELCAPNLLGGVVRQPAKKRPHPGTFATKQPAHSPPKLTRVIIGQAASTSMANGLVDDKYERFLEAKRASALAKAAEAAASISAGASAIKSATKFNNGRMLVRCEFCPASVDEREIVKHCKEKHPEKKEEMQRRKDDAKRLHDITSPEWAAMTIQAEKLTYRCPELACDFGAETAAVRDAHVKRIHRESYMVWMKTGRLQLQPGTKCPYCTKSTVKDVIALCQHAIKFHPIKMLEKKEIYSCSTCDSRFARVYEVYQHWYQDRECLGPLRVVCEDDVNPCLPMRAFAGDPSLLAIGGRETTAFNKLPPVVKTAAVKTSVAKAPVAKPIVVKKEKQAQKK